MSTIEEHQIKVAVFQEKRWWIAQGLDVDVSSQGHSRDEALERFCMTVTTEVDDYGGYDEFVELIGPPPDDLVEGLHKAETLDLVLKLERADAAHG